MKNKVLATILFSLLVVPLVQSADNSPRLVVGITVDQLRTDYLEALQHLFGEKGFKRLMREGVVCENLVFDFPNIDKASATATLYTGTTPFFHGIPSERFFNTAFLREEFILNDPSKIGNYTDETFSPERIRTSTLSDEVKIVSGGLGRVYAVAPDAQQRDMRLIALSGLTIGMASGRRPLIIVMFPLMSNNSIMCVLYRLVSIRFLGLRFIRPTVIRPYRI